MGGVSPFLLAHGAVRDLIGLPWRPTREHAEKEETVYNEIEVNNMSNMCRIMGQCQAIVAEAVEAFGQINILFSCTSEGKHP